MMLIMPSRSFVHSRLRCLAASFAVLQRNSAAFGIPVRSSSSALFSSMSLSATPDYNELPEDFPRRQDALVALEAVRKACAITLALQPDSSQRITTKTVSKLDLSPVTVGDFAAQAVVLRHLHEAFVHDSFIAEESSQALADDEGLSKEVLAATSMESVEIVMDSIQLGKQYELWDEVGRPPRVWCLDPIDGTKGFLRGKREGGQYCVALALLEDGLPSIGVLGCPNLPASPVDFDYAWRQDETPDNNQGSRGCIFVACQGGGCYQLPFIPGAPSQLLHVTPNDGSIKDPSEGRFCIGVERFSDALGLCARTARILLGDDALTDDGEIVNARRIDSQAKYGVLARAGAEYYARLPKPGYVEWIWDHAAGYVVLTEAGGQMTDQAGKEIDFSLGAKMSDHVSGVLGSNGGKFHSALVDAFQQQEETRLQSQN